MAERSGFFNALIEDGEADRKYNANDYADNLAVVIGNGVLRGSGDDLKVIASGMTLKVKTGRGWINGRWYNNDAQFDLATVSPPAGGSRWDRVVLQLDNSKGLRTIKARYIKGEVAVNPQKPEPVRSGDVYELVLADVYVKSYATSLEITDTRGDADLCGWVYSTSGDNSFFVALDNACKEWIEVNTRDFAEWFLDKKNTLASVTLFKRYIWRDVLTESTKYASFNLPQWDEETCFLEVYVNGVLDTEGVDYTRNGTVLTFTYALAAGTEIMVNMYKSIDGTGIMSVADEITELQNTVAGMTVSKQYDYFCNGYNDNMKISEIVKAYLAGGDDYSSMTLRIYGTFGAVAPYQGVGDLLSPYKWFDVSLDDPAGRKVTLDFSCCSQLTFPVPEGSLNYIFYGDGVHIVGADVNVYQKGVDTVVLAFSASEGEVVAENCRFWITAHTNSKVSCTGTFTNCRATVANTVGNSYCFTPLTNSLLRLNGGEYKAYTGEASGFSAVVGQSSTETNAVSILNGVNAPTVGRSGYYQSNSIKQSSGGGFVSCRDLISALPVAVIAGSSNVEGTIAKSKEGAG